MKLHHLTLLAAAGLLLPACDRHDRANAKQEAKQQTQEIKDDMNTSSTGMRIKGNWHELKGKLKQKYAELTDDDLLYVEGQEEELYGRLQQRLGKTRAEVEEILDDL